MCEPWRITSRHRARARGYSRQRCTPAPRIPARWPASACSVAVDVDGSAPSKACSNAIGHAPDRLGRVLRRWSASSATCRSARVARWRTATAIHAPCRPTQVAIDGRDHGLHHALDAQQHREVLGDDDGRVLGPQLVQAPASGSTLTQVGLVDAGTWRPRTAECRQQPRAPWYCATAGQAPIGQRVELPRPRIENGGDRRPRRACEVDPGLLGTGFRGTSALPRDVRKLWARIAEAVRAPPQGAAAARDAARRDYTLQELPRPGRDATGRLVQRRRPRRERTARKLRSRSWPGSACSACA